jgi:tetratricopeptide (TPR) repeat protein
MSSDEAVAGHTARRLDSWKEIGAYFGKDERTVKRWESQRGLPVHRLPRGSRSSVYAFTDELERWLRGGSGGAEIESDTSIATTEEASIPTAALLTPIQTTTPVAVSASAAGTPAPARSRLALFLIVAGILAGAGGVVTWLSRDAVQPTQPISSVFVPPADLPERVRELYLEGVAAWETRTPGGLTRAAELLEEAVTLAPDFAAGHVGLANTYNLISQYTPMSASNAYPRALAAGERALELDPDNADAYAALGFTTFYWKNDLAKARELFGKSLEINPDSSRTLHWYAMVMMHTGVFDESLAAINRAQQLDPSSRAILANKGLISYYAGRRAEALEILKGLASSAPEFLPPRHYLATIYLEDGDYAAYLNELTEAARIANNERLAAAVDAGRAALPGQGPAGMFTAMLAVQMEQERQELATAFDVARTAAMLGQRTVAMGYLQLSEARGEPARLGIRIDPQLKSLRDTPEFKALADRILPLDGVR